MASAVPLDRRQRRRQETIEQVLDVAAAVMAEQGVAGLTLGEIARRMGIRPPSLYVYFDSKNALFDAMFAEGNAELLRRTRALAAGVGASVDTLTAGDLTFFDFCVEDPARYQLLFLRTIPGFEPSEASYRLAQEALAQITTVLGDAGVGRPEHVDLWTATVSGLVAQQLSNDPGGDRWRRLVAPAVEMLLAARPSS